MKGIERAMGIIMLVGMLIISCKREQLDGDKARLIGKWQWVYTKVYNPQDSTSDTLHATNFADTYTIGFEEKGIMGWYKNGKRERKVNLEFDNYSCSNGQDLIVNYCSYRTNNGHYIFRIIYGLPEGTLLSIGNWGGKDWFPKFDLAPGLKYENIFLKIN